MHVYRCIVYVYAIVLFVLLLSSMPFLRFGFCWCGSACVIVSVFLEGGAGWV